MERQNAVREFRSDRYLLLRLDEPCAHTTAKMWTHYSCSYGAASRPSLAVADYWNPMRYNGTALEYGQGEPPRRSLPWDPVFVAGSAKNSGFFSESPYLSVDLVGSAFEA
jgi:hypothetical protein